MPSPEEFPVLPGSADSKASPLAPCVANPGTNAEPLSNNESASPWLKIDFHLHASEDPMDELDHSSIELLHRAHALGFDALAITLHNHVLTNPEVFDTARDLGILLIPAAEMRLEGADVVIVNLTEEEAKGLRRLRDLAQLRERRGESVLIFPPHPFYVLGGSIGKRAFDYMEIFDAIEFSHFYTGWFDPNRRAKLAAQAHGKPLLAASDTHLLDFFGEHYTLVDAPRNCQPEAIFDSIRAGRLRLVSQPLGTTRLIRQLWWIFVEHRLKLLRAKALRR